MLSTLSMAAAGLLLLAAGAASWIAVARARTRGAALDLAAQTGLGRDSSGQRWSGVVKTLPTRLELEVFPAGGLLRFGPQARRIGFALTASNPNGVAFVAGAKRLADERNFTRAAAELVLALERIHLEHDEELRVSGEGEIRYQLDLGWFGFATLARLQTRLLACQEVAKWLPVNRGIRSISRAMRLEAARPDSGAEMDKTEPAAQEKLHPGG